MALRRIAVADPARDATLQILDCLPAGPALDGVAVRLWEGTTWRRPHAPTLDRVTLVLNHPWSLASMLTSTSDLALGEMYVFDEVDVEGDMEAIFPVIDALRETSAGVIDRLRLGLLLKRLPHTAPRKGAAGPELVGAPHSKPRDARAVRYHYDVSNDFYSLWLDRRLVYSCAYFLHGEDTLDQAQEDKLDYICRKLRLKPGERLLDFGCGWGALIMHAAGQYGARVLGITVSPVQAELANQRIREAGLADRCRAEVRDYRDLDESERFDKLVSVGMFEHVGEKLLSQYFSRAWRLLKPGGAFLNHGIACHAHKPDHGPSFIAKYVFPDGELVPISTSLRIAEDAGWEVRDVESLREHYAITLHHWVMRLQQQADKARAIVGDTTYRIWRLYMAGCAHAFRRGWVNVYQALLVKPDGGDSRLPLTRADWYA